MKNYKFYKGEEQCPYEYPTDKQFFWSMEGRHSWMKEINPKFIEVLKGMFEQDYDDVHKLCTNDTEWEIVCLAIEDVYETRYYDFDENIDRIIRYANTRTA